MRCIKSIIISALSLLFSLGAMSFSVHASESRLRVKDGMVAHGLRVTPDGKELWLTTQLNDQITIINPKTLETIATLGAGRNPNWIEFTPDSKIAVVSNTSSNDVSLIDVEKRLLIKNVSAVKAPKRLAVGYVKATQGEGEER